MREIGYVQAFDTVRFNPELNDGKSLLTLLEDGYINWALYSVFYQIALSPNQIFDLPLLSFPKFAQLSLVNFPFKFSVDWSIAGSPTKFTDQLLILLRRKGDSVFVFGSMSDGNKRAESWNHFLADAEGDIPNEKILKEAKKPEFYPEAVERAAQLDRDAANMSVATFAENVSFGEAYEDVLSKSGEDVSLRRKSRSIVYREHQFTSGLTETNRIIKDRADLATAFSNASSIQAYKAFSTRLVLGPESNIPRLGDPLPILRIDIPGLIRKYKDEIRKPILGANASEIITAADKVIDHVGLGWNLIPTDRRAAIKEFSNAMSKFLNSLGNKLKIEAPGLSVSKEGEASIDIPLGGVWGFLNKYKFRGIDKFIWID
jgi:hypothetical protein